MAAPTVRKLNTLIKEIGQSVKPQKALIDENIAIAERTGQAQIAGLEAEKDQAFGQIEQSAQDKGMFFSGFSPSEQAQYTASSYLPALAQLQGQIAQTRTQLLGQKADLDRDVFNKAFAARESDRDFLNQWNKMTAEQKFQASEAEKQRAFQAQQAQIERNFAASQNAAARAHALADAALADKKAKAAINKVIKFLDPRRGADKKVSPSTFQQARTIWAKEGGTPEEFAQLFYGYINTSHADDYF